MRCKPRLTFNRGFALIGFRTTGLDRLNPRTCHVKIQAELSRRHTWLFYTPIAGIARCTRCSDCDFRRSPRPAYKNADTWHVRYRRFNSPSVPIPAIFYTYRCESPVKSTDKVGWFCHVPFQNTPRWNPGTRSKCHVAANGEKTRRVCQHQSVEKIACDQIRRYRRIKSPGVSPA